MSEIVHILFHFNIILVKQRDALYQDFKKYMLVIYIFMELIDAWKINDIETFSYFTPS